MVVNLSGPRRTGAAEMLGVTPTFLRALGAARLIEPARSSGGHRRSSRYQLRLAARARELEAACRIIILEDQLQRRIRTRERGRALTSAAWSTRSGQATPPPAAG